MTTNYFLYYIPGLKNGPEVKKKVCDLIGPSIQGCNLVCRNVTGGPGQSGGGLLVAAISEYREHDDTEIVRDLEYCADPDRQAWLEGAGFWVGYHMDHKPGPEDCARPSQVPGYAYDCPETGEWQVPLARKVDGTTLFDQRIVYTPDGEIQKLPLARFESLCAFAAEHFEFLSGLENDGEGVTVSADKRFSDVAVEALGVNYHVGSYELSMLGVLTISSAVLICGYLCDWPGITELMLAKDSLAKKNESTADTSTTNSGNKEK